jgi:hypothetical protein
MRCTTCGGAGLSNEVGERGCTVLLASNEEGEGGEI